MTKKAKTVPAVDLFIPAANIIKDNLAVFFVLLVIPALLNTQMGTPPPLSEQPTLQELMDAMRSTITPYVVIGSVLSLLFYPFLTYAFWSAARTGTIDFKAVVRGGSTHYVQLLGLLLLTSVLISFGLFLFIVPGIIALRSFALAPFYLIESKGKLGITGALKKSAAESRRYKWPIYGVLAVMLLFGILGSFGVIGQIAGTICTVLYAPALALRYKEIEA